MDNVVDRATRALFVDKRTDNNQLVR